MPGCCPTFPRVFGKGGNGASPLTLLKPVRGPCDIGTRGRASVPFICSVKEKGPLSVCGGPNPLVSGRLLIMNLGYVPDCIKFYCVFTQRADLGSQLAAERERKRTLRDHSEG